MSKITSKKSRNHLRLEAVVLHCRKIDELDTRTAETAVVELLVAAISFARYRMHEGGVAAVIKVAMDISREDIIESNRSMPVLNR